MVPQDRQLQPTRDNKGANFYLAFAEGGPSLLKFLLYSILFYLFYLFFCLFVVVFFLKGGGGFKTVIGWICSRDLLEASDIKWFNNKTSNDFHMTME